MAIQRVMLTDSRKEDVFYEEAIKTLRTNMQFSGVETKSIVITSCYPNEGKSDVAFQLAVEIGKMGKRVLIIDADIRKSSYIKRYQVKQKTNGLSQYLSGQISLEEIIYSTNYRNLEIIFSGPYAPNPSELLEQGRFGRLIEETRKVYDYILIDCMPSLGMLTINALASVDAVIIPVQAAYLPVKGLEQLIRTIGKVRRQLNKQLKIGGILITMVDNRTNYARDISDLIFDTYGNQIKIFPQSIPFSVRAAEISAEGISIFEHDPKGKVAAAYWQMTQEVLLDER